MRYVAMLRGIMPTNPNMKGEKLRQTFEGLGLTNVHTVITSGNIIFDSPLPAKKLEDIIEKELPAKLNFSSATIIRSQKQLQALVAQDPYKGTEHSRQNYQLVTFFKSSPKDTKNIPGFYDNQSVGALCTTLDATASKTPDFMSKLERQYGKAITSRTWKTINKILDKLDKTNT